MNPTIAASLSANPMNERSLLQPAPVLEEVRWVRALARQLVADEHLADDVAQDAWLAACERDASGAAVSRGWLAQVVRNALRMTARSAGHRRGRELAAARREALPATDELVAELEAHQRLMRAVHELEPLYREVIVLRFLRDLPPRSFVSSD